MGYVKILIGTLVGIMNIYLDLDGTLIDVSNRQWTVYKYILEVYFNLKSTLTKEDYWDLKREALLDDEVLHQEGISIDNLKFRDLKNKIIEDEKFLKLDRCFTYSKKTLKALSNNHRLVLVSLRNNYQISFRQIEQLGIKPYFHKIFFKRAEVKPIWKVKVEGIKCDMASTNKMFNTFVIVGDTENEFHVAQELKMPVILISSGSRSKNQLRKFGNNTIIEDIKFLPDTIKLLE